MDKETTIVYIQVPIQIPIVPLPEIISKKTEGVYTAAIVIYEYWIVPSS